MKTSLILLLQIIVTYIATAPLPIYAILSRSLHASTQILDLPRGGIIKAPDVKKNPYKGDEYKWPDNLYEEMRDMGSLAFFIYQFAYILDAARKENAENRAFIGLKVPKDGFRINKSASSALKRSFTPREIKKLIQDNQEALARHYDNFVDPSGVYELLDRLEERSKSSGLNRAITLVEFDDTYQDEEVVYGVIKDNVNKRITLIFRGTENALAMKSNWKHNASIFKKKVKLPKFLQDKTEDKHVKLHSGFYDYAFGKTADEDDPEKFRKYDQILADIKPLLKQYPDHKLYVTGHSLGGAMTNLVSFFLACEEDIPKPVSCISFASPRVGGKHFLSLMQYMEKTKQIRILRSVNENDYVAVMPSVGYKHAGFQITAFKSKGSRKAPSPEIHYPNKKGSLWSKAMMGWTNSPITNFNVGYDHGDYVARIEDAKEHLEKTDLNTLYSDPKRVGFEFE